MFNLRSVSVLLLSLGAVLIAPVAAQVPDPATPPNAPKIQPVPDDKAGINYLNCRSASSANQKLTQQPRSKTAIVNVNLANCDELLQLQGINAASADKIIANRPYTFLNDLVTKGVLTNQQLKSLEAQITLTKASSPVKADVAQDKTR